MALPSPARGCSVLMSLLLVAVVAAVAAASAAVTPADLKWTERHGAHSHEAPSSLPSAAAPAVPPPSTTPGQYPPHGAAAAAPGPTPPQGAEAPAPSPDHSGGAAAVPFAWPTVLLLVAAGVAAATMV